MKSIRLVGCNPCDNVRCLRLTFVVLSTRSLLAVPLYVASATQRKSTQLADPLGILADLHRSCHQLVNRFVGADKIAPPPQERSLFSATSCNHSKCFGFSPVISFFHHTSAVTVLNGTSSHRSKMQVAILSLPPDSPTMLFEDFLSCCIFSRAALEI